MQYTVTTKSHPFAALLGRVSGLSQARELNFRGDGHFLCRLKSELCRYPAPIRTSAPLETPLSCLPLDESGDIQATQHPSALWNPLLFSTMWVDDSTPPEWPHDLNLGQEPCLHIAGITSVIGP